MSTMLHALLALVLTLGLVVQLQAFRAVLRSRPAACPGPRPGDLVWAALPVAVVLALAARSWMIALDLLPPPVAAFPPPESGDPLLAPPIRPGP
jgi:heme/copper-type cytochrome/quinol oxidase subunit 2